MESLCVKWIILTSLLCLSSCGLAEKKGMSGSYYYIYMTGLQWGNGIFSLHCVCPFCFC